MIARTSRFSFSVAVGTVYLHLVCLFVVLVISIAIEPEMESHYGFADTIEEWLLGPSILAFWFFERLFQMPLPGVAVLLVLPLSPLAWGCLAGLLWPLVRRTPPLMLPLL
jgi:hypothetical protein